VTHPPLGVSQVVHALVKLCDVSLASIWCHNLCADSKVPIAVDDSKIIPHVYFQKEKNSSERSGDVAVNVSVEYVSVQWLSTGNVTLALHPASFGVVDV